MKAGLPDLGLCALATALNASFGVWPGATLAAEESPSRLIRNAEITGIASMETAIGFDQGSVQKTDFILEPEFYADLPASLRFTAIGRLRFDAQDRLEPARPDQGERDTISRRALIGDHGDLELRELFLDGYWHDLSFRLGKQQVVWGQADGLRVLDQVNPLDFREFILGDFEDRRIPLWMLNLEYALNDGALELVWIPDQTYADLPDAGALFEFTSPKFIPAAPPLGTPIASVRRSKPERFMRDSDFGVRLSQFLGGWDLSLNYLYHYEDTPVTRRRLGASGIEIETRYERSHLVGGTASNVFGKFTFRGEFGYSTGRHFLTQDITQGDGITVSDEGLSSWASTISLTPTRS